METSWYGIFELGEDDRVEIRAGDLQEFLRQQMMGNPNPGLEVEVSNAKDSAQTDLKQLTAGDGLELTGYERYQLEWMIDHGHSLGDLMKSMSILQRDYEVAPDYNKTVEELFGTWADDQGFGGEIFASEEEWRDGENPDPRSQSVRDWYMKTFPTDKLGAEIDPDITFDGALSVVEKGPAFYDGLGVRDSLVRERVFMELSERYDIDYGDIYESWLNSKPLPDHALLKTALGEQVYEDMKAAMEPHIAEFEKSLDEVLASMRESSSALDGGRGGEDSTVER